MADIVNCINGYKWGHVSTFDISVRKWHLSTMVRQLRIEYEHVIYHIYARGHRKEHIFRDNFDKKNFLEKLSEVSEKFQILVHLHKKRVKVRGRPRLMEVAIFLIYLQKTF